MDDTSRLFLKQVLVFSYMTKTRIRFRKISSFNGNMFCVVSLFLDKANNVNSIQPGKWHSVG